MFFLSSLSNSVDLEMLMIVIQFISQILRDFSAFCCSISPRLKRMGANAEALKRSVLPCQVFHFSSENGKPNLLSTLQVSLMYVPTANPQLSFPHGAGGGPGAKLQLATPITKVTRGITPVGSLHEIRDRVRRSLLHSSLDCFFPPPL